MRGAGRARAIRRLGPLLALACACTLPAAAYAQAGVTDSLRLTWTSPADDGPLGRALAYEVRRASSLIVTEADYAQAVILPDAPAPAAAGAPQSMRVRGLTPGSAYWFCIRSVDGSGNWSGLSNVLRWDGALDTAPPVAPANVVARSEDDGKVVRVSWQPNAEPDLAGYLVYRAETMQGPWAEAGRVTGSRTEFLDQRLPETPELVYQVAAFDSRGNVSARSRAVVVRVGAAAPSEWRLLPAYPNPARGDDVQRIPVAAPAASLAAIEVLDAAEQRVRRLEAVVSVPGLIEFRWDGRNDAGRLCAPGVYRAWLIADGVRRSIRVARLP